MSNKLYRYKQLACTVGKKHIKSWTKPITVIRKRGNLTCEGCFFTNTQRNQLYDRCALMLKSEQLPTCYPNFIFIRVLKTPYEISKAQRNYEKLQKKLKANNAQES
jgi:hypothetical protein